ncbi:MAG: hypothetical protein D4R77_01580 [Planctomycetaceae bacterium]|nr:MAG: hypothetical protein D4R77_01580 [Planctomycetaceae bacterium]
MQSELMLTRNCSASARSVSCNVRGMRTVTTRKVSRSEGRSFCRDRRSSSISRILAYSGEHSNRTSD